MIVGIGVDLVDIARFERTHRAHAAAARAAVRSDASGALPPRSLAARYAAKEALIKALGGSDGVHWTEIEITPEASGSSVVHAHRLDAPPSSPRRGITTLHLSMSHDAGFAIAYVIAEGARAGRVSRSARGRDARGRRSTSARSAANVRHLRRLTDSEVIAVVKADGYGHGAVRAAVAALAGRRHAASASPTSARRSPSAGPASSRRSLAWLHAPGADFAEAAALGIELGISSFDQLQQAAAAASADRPVGVHLKLETGLARNGIAPDDWRVVFAEAARLERIGRLRVVALFSHLSNASADDDRAALALVRGGRRGRGIPRSRPAAAAHRRHPRGHRTCPSRASAACASASACTDCRRSPTAPRPTSASARR